MANISTYLLAIIGCMFVLQMIIPGFTEALIFNPYLAFSEPWRFLTSMFLHDPGSIMHIFFNAYALFMFGSILETRISGRDYLSIFFGAGLIGGLIYYLTTLGPWPPLCGDGNGLVVLCSALGASGAIYGILGAVAILLPDMRIFFMFFPIRMREAAFLWIILEFLGTFDSGSGVGNAAHLGGLLFGLAYAWYLKNKHIPQEYSEYPVYEASWQN
ncbi:MAG: rhomboid family intramembrane serine protease [Candidatus Micrarchaeota archaeon]